MTSSHLSAPLTSTGKRSRSYSSSSSSSTTSSTGGSIFSQYTLTSSADSLSSCSSPENSNDASPLSDDQRPCKTLRTERASSTEVTEGLETKCSLDGEGERDGSADGGRLPLLTETLKPASSGEKTLFVDCLVDAAAHVLDTIWEAPLDRSIAFVCDEAPTRAAGDFEGNVRSCVCPAGRPMTGGIPLDLFIRESLRRSRTSCSTLQAALLFCKRAGGEVVRRRAAKEGITLSEEQLAKLPGATNTYFSLQSQPPNNDSILCSRRIFLASIMVSSKFLQDRTFSNRAWSKISGLNVRELSIVERRLLTALDFDLNVREQGWSLWTHYLKGEWRTGTPCNDDNGRAFLPSPIRKSLERTISLPEEEVFDADVALPSGDQKVFFTNDFESPTTPSNRIDVDASTPTQNKSACQLTPTSAPAICVRVDEQRGASSLLSMAVHNHAMHGSTNDMSLPFPLRKGLALRSISSF